MPKKLPMGLIVLMFAANCFCFGYWTHVLWERHQQSAITQTMRETRQRRIDAMDKAVKTGKVLDGSDYVKFQDQKLH